MLPIFVGLGGVTLVSFLVTFALFCTGRPQAIDHPALQLLISFVVMLGAVFGIVVMCLIAPYVDEAYAAILLPLMIPAVFLPWLASGFGCAIGDLVWNVRHKRK